MILTPGTAIEDEIVQSDFFKIHREINAAKNLRSWK